MWPLIPEDYLNSQGEPRRVGVEIELSGLELDRLTALIQQTVGGRIERTSDYKAYVVDSEVGTVRVEFDATLFRELQVRQFLDETELLDPSDRQAVERTLASIAGWLVPYELVFDPLPVARLTDLERIRARIGSQAEGTSAFATNAFGLHFNVELPDLEPSTIVRYLRAFLVLYEELKEAHRIDPARALSGFLQPFPREYELMVLDPGYTPDQNRLIDDYLAANPSRSRGLDLLPVLAWLDEARVRAVLPEEKISKRPALHYRLPNSLIDQAGWSLSLEWAIWMKVEHLASNPARLAKLCRYRLKRLQGPVAYWLRRLWRTKPLLSNKPMIAVTGPDQGGFPAWACTWLAVKRAGGRPIRLTPSMFQDDPSLPPFEGLILGGGADVDPLRYREEWEELLSREPDSPPPRLRRVLSRLIAPLIFVARSLFSLTTSEVDRERDEFEASCLERALDKGLPVLGICRGAQFINVHLGGDLCEDIGAFYGEVGRVSTLLPRNPVQLEPDSRLAQVLGLQRLRVNSLHSQAVKRLGRGLRVVAQTEAGIVQGIESKDGSFLLGVQWHPEYLPVSRVQQRLFQELVQAALEQKAR